VTAVRVSSRVQRAAACIALLPGCVRVATSSGAAGADATSNEWTTLAGVTCDAYTLFALRVIALAHYTLDTALACVAEPSDSTFFLLRDDVLA
jgi:hypothetical protein